MIPWYQGVPYPVSEDGLPGFIDFCEKNQKNFMPEFYPVSEIFEKFFYFYYI